MYDLETLIILILITLVIGLIFGAIFTQRAISSKQTEHQHEKEQNLEDLQQQSEYQQEVVEHFSETGELLNQLAKSYRDVHHHLANSALALNENKENDSLDLMPDNQKTKLLQEEQYNLIPPLDHAAKTTIDEQKSSNEKYIPQEK